MDKEKICVVLINYRTPQMTVECVNNLLKQTYDNLSIIVVDNHSEDGSINVLRKIESSRCYVIEAKDNLGFSAGNNIGLEFALEIGAEKILFINNDTESDPNLVRLLAEKCDKETISIPKTYYFDDKTLLWDTGFDVSPSGKFFNRGIGQRDNGQFDKEENVPLFSGHCLMIDKETIAEVGNWNESYFMYHEDTEYAYRLRRAGKKIRYVPNAKLWHKVGISGGGNKSPYMMYYVIRNRLYYLNQFNCPILWKIRNSLWILSLMIRYRLMGQEQYKYANKAVNDYLKKRMGKVTF